MNDLIYFDTLRGANIHRQRNEWDQSGKIDLDYRVNELVGEMGEVCNIIKKLERENLGIPGTRALSADLASKLGDVIICIDLVCAAINYPEFDLSPLSVSRAFKLTRAGVDLCWQIGNACGAIGSHLASRDMHVWFSAAMSTIKAMCDHIDQLPYNVAARKFNATSVKLNFKTRMR